MKHTLCLLCLLASFALYAASARAEALLSVYINEICASNGGHYTIGESAPDYVELRNLTDQALSLDGFFISDDEDHLQKFSLDGYSIPENGYIILAADKKELPFKLSASGGDELFLSDADGNILQRVSLPPLKKDETYSLQENGEWQLTDPSPLEANEEGIPYVEKAYVASPRFSHEAGFYDDPFDLTLEGYKTYQLYYTTDGSVPDENSTLYTGPIHIEDATSQPNKLSKRTDITIRGATPPSSLIKKATIIRAVAIDPDGNRSNDVVKTYFVGFQNYESYQNIAILSIVADPYDLFDKQDGIYVRGKVYKEWLSDENRDQDLAPERIPTNYKQHGREWEIPVSIQWFGDDHLLQLSQSAGLRIHGDWSRENAKKSFNLYARKEYGASTFSYDILPGLPDKEKLVVRTNLARDSLLHALLQETGLPISSCTPCLTFINGEFWGFYEIRDKQTAKDIAGFFGLNKKDLLVVKIRSWYPEPRLMKYRTRAPRVFINF
ncbi:MAG: chitobiase/beta-hexosaminidase C-terminal domain-containing protein [Clostridia bacterium]|nr:chitobiase/beta-hexosaminidase C-terminal domain-containing protein [Clostridia bacterium]